MEDDTKRQTYTLLTTSAWTGGHSTGLMCRMPRELFRLSVTQSRRRRQDMWKTATGKDNFAPFRQISSLHISEKNTETTKGLLRSFQRTATYTLRSPGLTRSSPLRTSRAVRLSGLYILKQCGYVERRGFRDAHHCQAQSAFCGVQENAMGSKLESGWTTERGASKHGTDALNDHHRTTQASALGTATVIVTLWAMISGVRHCGRS